MTRSCNEQNIYLMLLEYVRTWHTNTNKSGCFNTRRTLPEWSRPDSIQPLLTSKFMNSLAVCVSLRLGLIKILTLFKSHPIQLGKLNMWLFPNWQSSSCGGCLWRKLPSLKKCNLSWEFYMCSPNEQLSWTASNGLVVILVELKRYCRNVDTSINPMFLY